MNIVKGDLLKLARDGLFDVVVQGCNCFNTMGGGIARQIRVEYPEAYEVDRATISGDRDKLGTYTQVKVRDGFVIINAYTQYGFNRAGDFRDVFEYESFERILNKLSTEFKGCSFGLPFIGCGLAGGHKDTILRMIADFSKIVEKDGGVVTVVEYDR